MNPSYRWGSALPLTCLLGPVGQPWCALSGTEAHGWKLELLPDTKSWAWHTVTSPTSHGQSNPMDKPHLPERGSTLPLMRSPLKAHTKGIDTRRGQCWHQHCTLSRDIRLKGVCFSSPRSGYQVSSGELVSSFNLMKVEKEEGGDHGSVW